MGLKQTPTTHAGLKLKGLELVSYQSEEGWQPSDNEPKVFGFKKNTFQQGLFVLAAIALLAAPLILFLKPTLYTAPMQVIFSVGLSWIFYWLGSQQKEEDAIKRANDRWLPQAESVVLSLMTLRSNVTRFSRKMKKNCSEGYCDLPELNEAKFKSVKVKMLTDCEASSERLDNIGHQIDDAVADWTRFVTANCTGEECSRIWEAFYDRKQTLHDEIKQEDVENQARLASAAEPV